MPKYRVFVQDVGAYGYSGFSEVSAGSPEEALEKLNCDITPKRRRPFFIALPHNRKDLWPNSKTGKVPQESLKYARYQ